MNDYRIIMLPDWKQMVLSIEQSLSSDDLRLLLILYTELSELSSLVRNNNAGDRWQLDAYALLTTVNEQFSSLQQVLDKLKTISQKR